jgi:RNA polymerase sigma-70 factor (ECF subfamily)
LTARIIPIRRLEGKKEEMSDEALIAACAVADHAALVALFDRHHLRLHRFLCRIASTSAFDADDLLQDTFSAVWSSAEKYKGDAPALTWLFGIAANVARNYARSRERRARLIGTFEKQPIAAAEAIDEVAARKEQVERLQKALLELPHDHRVALVMCDLEGASGADAAAVLGVRPGTIWRWLHEARKTLREALKEDHR